MRSVVPRPTRARGRRRDGGDGRRGAWVVLAGLVVGVLGSGGLVWQGTNAAFTASTSNGANAWSSGTVALSDDDTSTALFSAGPVVPGDTGTRCIAVTYDGDIAASVRFYASSVSGSLGTYLGRVVEQGSGAGNVGGAGSCAGFSGTTIWNGTLDALATSASGFATGLGTCAPTGAGQTTVYRITWTVDPGAGDALQGTAASASFVWEAQS